MAGSLSRAQRRRRRSWGKGLALLLVAAVPMSTIDFSPAVAADGPAGTKPGKHKPQPAPQQREGSAAGQPQVIGNEVNKTVPASLKSRYPERQLSTAPPKATNDIKVVSAPVKPVHGF